MTDRINEKLGAWLLEKGHNSENLAAQIGISRPALRDRLNGEAQWKWGEVIRVAEITNCTLNELAGYESTN